MFGAAGTAAPFREDSAAPAAKRTAIREVMVANVYAAFERLRGGAEIAHLLKTMHWGNGAAQIRGPEGTILPLHTPVADTAKTRFGSR